MFHTYLTVYQTQTEPLTIALSDGETHGLCTIADILAGDWTIIAEVDEAKEWLFITMEHASYGEKIEQFLAIPYETENAFTCLSQTEGLQFVLGKTGVRMKNDEPSPHVTYHIISKRNEDNACILIRLEPIFSQKESTHGNG